MLRPFACVVFVSLMTMACSRASSPTPGPAAAAARPWILLVTLDTTRADAIGPDAAGAETPAFNALAARGRRFRQAYATVPETLPSHTSMMTGLYPAGHGVHENARYVGLKEATLAERLKTGGYRTAAFVSSFVLSRRFGIARGFDVFDDELGADAAERDAGATTAKAIEFLNAAPAQPLFLWVHYFDPHAPYTPPEPFRTRYAGRPYQGEIAAMDQQLGRLVQTFEQRATGPVALLVVGDHGEGLGDHGEAQHGHLLYQSTVHVPLVLMGPGVEAGVSETAVSTRRVFHTVLDWAGVARTLSLRGNDSETVLGEAMKPFLEYGWQPQTMAIDGKQKAILAGTLETYDLAADPSEARNLGSGINLPPGMRKHLEDYPVPATGRSAAQENLDQDARRRLASLGYIGGSAPPPVRKDAPRPAEMMPTLEIIERASGLFVNNQYAEAIPLFEKILAADPLNLDAALRLATAHSMLNHDDRAVDGFRKAARIAPQSGDVRLYLALHYARGGEWAQAVPILERIVADTPQRLPALEALARLRERQGRREEALTLWQTVYGLRAPTAAESVHLGLLAMSTQRTQAAIDAFEQARGAQGSAFAYDLELGVVYLAARRFTDARDALDRVPSSHRDYPMALFKRAQVSVLLSEPDRQARIDAATRRANATTRQLIAQERLFQK